MRELILRDDLTRTIPFSPYGNPQRPEEGNHPEYGVYITTKPGPRHEDTVKIHGIGYLFNETVLSTQRAL